MFYSETAYTTLHIYHTFLISNKWCRQRDFVPTMHWLHLDLGWNLLTKRSTCF